MKKHVRKHALPDRRQLLHICKPVSPYIWHRPYDRVHGHVTGARIHDRSGQGSNAGLQAIASSCSGRGINPAFPGKMNWTAGT